MCTWQRGSRNKQRLLEILKCSMPSSDLWSSGVWGLAQTWAGRTVSVFWSLSVPHPSERGVKLSDVSVWVTVVSCSRFPTSCRIGGFHTGKWFLVWPKVLWNLHEPHLSTESVGEAGLFSLLFWLTLSSDWPSRSFPEEKVKILLVACELLWSLAASSQTVQRAESRDSNWNFFYSRETKGPVSWETFCSINHVS